MKFKVKNTFRYEFMINKNIEKVEIEIDGKMYQEDTEYDIEKGNYNVDVHIQYTDGSSDVFKNQEMELKKDICKVDLYAKSYGKLVQNLFVNKWFAVIFIIMIALSILVPYLSTFIIIAGTYITLAIGNDFVLKKYGFDETVRVKFK